MASKRSGSKAKSGGGAKAGKGKATMASLKDLEARGSQKIRGGRKAGRTELSELQISKVVDKSSADLF